MAHRVTSGILRPDLTYFRAMKHIALFLMTMFGLSPVLLADWPAAEPVSPEAFAEEAREHYQSYAADGALKNFVGAHSDADRDAAYAFQEAYTQAFREAGDEVMGYKLGFTGKAAPPGAEAPVLGRLFASQQATVGKPFKLAELANPILEVELAFRFAEDVPKDAEIKTIRAAVGEVAGCIEIPNPDYQEPEAFHGLNFIAHNVVSRRFKIFDWKPLERVGELAALKAVLTRPDGRTVPFESANVLPDRPHTHFSALEFAVDELAARGHAIRAGDVVITGSMGKALAKAKDDTGDSPEDTLYVLEPGEYTVDYGAALGKYTFEVMPRG